MAKMKMAFHAHGSWVIVAMLLAVAATGVSRTNWRADDGSAAAVAGP